MEQGTKLKVSIIIVVVVVVWALQRGDSTYLSQRTQEAALVVEDLRQERGLLYAIETDSPHSGWSRSRSGIYAKSRSGHIQELVTVSDSGWIVKRVTFNEQNDREHHSRLVDLFLDWDKFSVKHVFWRDVELLQLVSSIETFGKKPSSLRGKKTFENGRPVGTWVIHDRKQKTEVSFDGQGRPHGSWHLTWKSTGKRALDLTFDHGSLISALGWRPNGEITATYVSDGKGEIIIESEQESISSIHCIFESGRLVRELIHYPPSYLRRDPNSGVPRDYPDNDRGFRTLFQSPYTGLPQALHNHAIRMEYETRRVRLDLPSWMSAEPDDDPVGPSINAQWQSFLARIDTEGLKAEVAVNPFGHRWVVEVGKDIIWVRDFPWPNSNGKESFLFKGKTFLSFNFGKRQDKFCASHGPSHGVWFRQDESATEDAWGVFNVEMMTRGLVGSPHQIIGSPTYLLEDSYLGREFHGRGLLCRDLVYRPVDRKSYYEAGRYVRNDSFWLSLLQWSP